MNHPEHRLIAGDTLIGDDSTCWYTWGPRVMRGDVDVDSPREGEEPQFWGVYRWLWEDGGEWRWVMDASCEQDAQASAWKLLLNPDFQPEPEQIAP